MPAALPLETKQLVQALILQGIKPSVVANKTGVKYATINTLAYRQGWRKTIDKAKQELAMDVRHGIADDVAQLSVKSRTNLSKIVAGASESLANANKPSKSLKRLKAIADTAKVIADTGDTVFGWSADAEDTIVSVSVLRELAEPGALDIKPCQTLSDNPAVIPDTIDVQSTPAQPDNASVPSPAIDQPVSGE